MGINTRICVVKKTTDSLDDFLEKLAIKCVIESIEKDFDGWYNKIHFDRTNSIFGISQHEKFWLMIDDNVVVSPSLINFSEHTAAELLIVDNSDTTGASFFSFFKDGKLIREIAVGAEWFLEGMEEMDRAGELDEDGKEYMKTLSLQLEGIGEEQPFEKDGSDGFTVLRNYALDYNEFFKMNWNIVRIIQS